MSKLHIYLKILIFDFGQNDFGLKKNYAKLWLIKCLYTIFKLLVEKKGTFIIYNIFFLLLNINTKMQSLIEVKSVNNINVLFFTLIN